MRERLSEHLPVEVAQPRVDLGLCAVVGLFVLREAAPEHEVRHAVGVLRGIGNRHGTRVVTAEEREPLEAHAVDDGLEVEQLRLQRAIVQGAV